VHAAFYGEGNIIDRPKMITKLITNFRPLGRYL
jgi:hypothetical protein